MSARYRLMLVLATASIGAQGAAWRLRIRSGGQDLLVREDGSIERVLGSAAKGPEPLLSPDGRRRAILSLQEDTAVLSVSDAQGRGLRQVATSVSPGDVPSWSSDGERLAFSSRQEGSWQVYVADLRSGKVARISRGPAPAWKPSFLPDGRVAYLSGSSGSAGPGQLGPTDLLVAGDRGLTVVLEKHNITDFAPSPDGRLVAVGIGPPSGRLVFADLRGPSRSDVDFARDIDKRLFSHGAFQLVWRPDSAVLACRISFVGNRLEGAAIFGDAEVFVIRPGSRVTWFSMKSQYPLLLGWSPEPR